MRCILLIVALSLMPVAALSMTFSTPIPDLVGVIDFTTAFGKEASFDFGQEFSEITAVFIEIDAHVFALEFDHCGTISSPEPCSHVLELLGFVAIIDEEDMPIPGLIFSREIDISDELNVPEASGVGQSFFTSLMGFDVLLDGKGSLVLFWNLSLRFPEEIIGPVVIQPTGEIFSARLIIEGTPIPEPSTSLLLALGLMVLSGTKERK